ncbi:nucleotidyltransferase domain-containing protein [Pyrofollis japonicus]|jgi:predicted nucleotidyltransferase|uniref:nucleotidyltransferase domain-containing protein n=1 Tax=Pyrofollis japonicus TaxID=3060460 RepID=UPI00295B6DBD|nr:nucleotidyltransferase domain-containing protein [Pyrofollis japonicus]BEP17244.1 nucleotidyltransferase domain-containing protein [Pyrofollis japonicus]
MSRLSIREDIKKRSIRFNEKQLEAIKNLLASALQQRDEVVLAILFGGLLIRGKPVRDIDVAVYTDYRVGSEEWPVYVDELRHNLEKLLRIELGIEKAVDVVLLEYAPPKLRAEILSKGLILVDKVPGIRSVLLLHARDELARFTRRLSRETAQLAV